MPHPRGSLLVSSLAGAVLSWASVAAAGNDEGVFMGNQAALTGGAVTANISEGSAIWYNPAGVAAVPRQSLDISASAYGFRFYSSPGLLISDSGETAPVNVTEIISIPSAAAYVRPLSDDVSLGLGVFVPRSDHVVLRNDLRSATAGRWILTQVEYDFVAYAGGSLAWAVTRDLRLGASVLGYLDYSQIEEQFAGGTPGTGAMATFLSSSQIATRATVGALITGGVQWDATEHVSLGASLRSPSLDAYTTSSDDTVTAAAFQGDMGPEPSFAPDATSARRQEFRVTQPPQVRLGVAYDWGGGFAALGGDVSSELERAGVEQQQWRFNARLGAMQTVAAKFMIGGGVFTDRDSEAEDPTGAGPVHFYGGSMGVRWGTVYDVVDDPDTDELDFSTTIALRYAYGTGDTTALRVGPITTIDSLATAATATSAPIHVHEISVHVGSGVYF